ncbi:MAG: lipocalin family protein [Chthoniobacterales bacterium]|nr:lipocalin family protein [Chthoniobacterales bacterium]
MKKWILPALVAGGLLCSCSTLPPPTTVGSVDLARYCGTWHEIEAFPNVFQRGCQGSTATYTALPDGKIRVVNSCVRNGKTVSVTGTATPVPGSNNSRLKVRFFGPFAGDYWILDLDKNYRWVAVGHPNRQYLWILARTPNLDSATLARIRTRLAAQGYDISRLVASAEAPDREAL